MSVNPVHVGKLFQAGAVRVNGEDVEICAAPANERNDISPRRPDGKVVPFIGQYLHCLLIEIHDAQAISIGAGRAVDNVFAIRPKRCEGVVAVSRGNQVEPGAVGIQNAHLCSAIDRIDRPLCPSIAVKERSEVADPNNHLLAIRGPRRTEDQILPFENGARRFSFVDDQQIGRLAVGAYFGYREAFSSAIVCG